MALSAVHARIVISQILPILVIICASLMIGSLGISQRPISHSQSSSAAQWARHPRGAEPRFTKYPVSRYGLDDVNNVPILPIGQRLTRQSSLPSRWPVDEALATMKHPSTIVGYAGRDVTASNVNNEDRYYATEAVSRPSYIRAAAFSPSAIAAAERRRRYAVQLIKNARKKRQGYGAPAPPPPTSVGPVYTFARTDTAGNYKWGVRHSIP